ncbi:MAG: methyltransferase [Erysipelotrichaceae bacterium]|nr:methyltransferase [Erysipelotrichaceae bacterium 7770_A6]MDD7059060.1 methyltransferase [Erysipelotrichaceae bacterium]
MEKTLIEIHDEARKEHVPIMLDDGMAFLLNYIRKHEGVRDILEVGTAVGFSAINMAKIRWDNTIDTLEINPKMYEKAIQNIKNEKLDDRIHVHLIDGAAFETNKIYDLIFIDAAKSQYRRYLEHFMKNSRIGTVFIFDNLNFHGIVDNEELSSNRSTIQMVHKIKKFREHLLNDDRFITSYYEVGDGIAVSVRKK